MSYDHCEFSIGDYVHFNFRNTIHKITGIIGFFDRGGWRYSLDGASRGYDGCVGHNERDLHLLTTKDAYFLLREIDQEDADEKRMYEEYLKASKNNKKLILKFLKKRGKSGKHDTRQNNYEDVSKLQHVYGCNDFISINEEK